MTTKKRKIPFKYNGETYDSKKRACEELGVVYNSVFTRSNKNKISFEEALDDYVHGRVEEKPRQTIVIDGKAYTTIKMACDDLNVPYSNVGKKRRREGITAQEAIKKILAERILKFERMTAKENGKKHRKKNPFIYHGIPYPSLTAVCLIHGTTAQRVQMRTKLKNLSKQEALDEYVNGQVKKMYYEVTINGKVYPSVKSACRELGLDFEPILAMKSKAKQEIIENVLADCKQWVKEGNDLGKAITNEKLAKFLEMGEVDLADPVLTEMQRSLDNEKLSQKDIVKILIKRAEKVASLPKREKQKKNKPFIYRGNTYASIIEACRTHEVNTSSVYYYATKENISIHEALDFCVNKRSERMIPAQKPKKIKKRPPFIYQGKSYETISEACRFYGIKEKNIHTRAYQKNISKQEALDDYRNNRVRPRTSKNRAQLRR